MASTTVENHHRLIYILCIATALHLFLLFASWGMVSFTPLHKFPLSQSQQSQNINIALHNITPNSQVPQPEATPLVPKRTVSAAAHESKDAAYLERWQTYVEHFGNNHYPQEALKKDLRGNVRLLVAIKRDGSLHEVTVRHSSGVAFLDNAAINMVKQAAPFEPLPEEIAKDIEVLEIIRTWQFLGTLSTY